MNKKYIIFNSEQSADFLSSYLFYIILISCLICISSNYMNYYNEYFNTTMEDDNSLITMEDDESLITNDSQDSVKNLIDQNNDLSNKLNMLEEKVALQNRLLFISNNYIKINENSFPDQLKLINLYFKHIDLPEIDLSTYSVISKQEDFNDLLNEAEKFVNLYKPGDLVNKNSSFNIDKNTICYKNIKDTEYINAHPDCMVCSVNNDYLDTRGWNNTRTNINTLCLFNKDAEVNSGIPSENDCKKLCNINNL